MNQPLYRSLRESFSKDIPHAVTPVVAAPVDVLEVRFAQDLDLLRGNDPPQNVIFHISYAMRVMGADGQDLGRLEDAMALCTRTVPILFVDEPRTVVQLRAYFMENRIRDVMLGAAFRDAYLLKLAARKMPEVRSILDCREMLYQNPGMDLRTLPGELVSFGAENVLFWCGELTRERVHLLQQSFIHVYGFAGAYDAFDALSLGLNGIVTDRIAQLYAALESFPENSFLRRRCLYAHKGFQYSGKYSENTISGVRAAGEYGFDGAEIDVKFTSDFVPVVMHNLNTKGLFDCEPLVTEEVPYDALKPLRRIGFPEEGIDRFEDLMREMKRFPDTPVVIELKPSEKYHRVEEMADQVRQILRSGESQRGALGIMGNLTPGLSYVHEAIPELPLAYVEGGKEVPPAPADRSEAEERLYRISGLLSGTAAAYNPEDVNINRLFNEYAKFRGLNVLVWSRSWTLSPSKWEEHGPDNDRTFLAGYDGWTTDHGDMYLDLPVEIEVPEDFPETISRDIPVFCTAKMRDGSSRRMQTEVFFIEGGFDMPGPARVMLQLNCPLHFGDTIHLYSPAFHTVVAN